MKRKAYAKLNLSLAVINKREDGYHNIESVMVPLDLYDVVNIEIASKDSFDCNIDELKDIPNNTVVKVINTMRDSYGFKERFKVDLKKNIPMQAGLAGGSSDGAATILLIDELLKLNMSKVEKEELAARIGKDVVFCLYQKAAYVKGAGEDLTFFDNNLEIKGLLVKPQGGISTKVAYELLDLKEREKIDVKAMQKALEGNDYQVMLNNIRNNFEEVAGDLLLEVTNIKKELTDFGFDNSILCGSGSCVFAVTNDTLLLEKALSHFKDNYPFVKVSRVKRSNHD